MNKNESHEQYSDKRKELSKSTVSITTTFSLKTSGALLKYAKEKGFSNTQEIIRMAVTNFLSKTGYL